MVSPASRPTWLRRLTRSPSSSVSAAEAPAWARDLPPPTAVPRLLEPASELDDSEMMLGRTAVYVLLEIDGQRSVRDIAARHGVVRSLQALATLRDMGLMRSSSALRRCRPHPAAPGLDGAASVRHRRHRSACVTTPAPPPVAGGARWRRGGRDRARHVGPVRGPAGRAGGGRARCSSRARSYRTSASTASACCRPSKPGRRWWSIAPRYFHLDGTPFEGLLTRPAQGSVNVPVRWPAARRHRRLSRSAAARCRLHQAGDRPARRPRQHRERPRVHQRPADRRAVHPLSS